MFGIKYSDEVELLAPREYPTDKNILLGGPYTAPTNIPGVDIHHGKIEDLPPKHLRVAPEIPARF
jgi:hypothetical protein